MRRRHYTILHLATTQRGVNYALGLFPRQWWWEVWVPSWHEGRGPYVSISLGVIALYRGY